MIEIYRLIGRKPLLKPEKSIKKPQGLRDFLDHLRMKKKQILGLGGQHKAHLLIYKEGACWPPSFFVKIVHSTCQNQNNNL